MRCQACRGLRLRQIANRGIRNASQPYRPFSQSSRSYDDPSEDLSAGLEASTDGANDNLYTVRRFHPQGRVVGNRGRRQRETREPLAIHSLERPSEVIVLRDVRERSRKSPDILPGSQQDLNRQDIAHAVATQDDMPTQDEVDASLDDLRPSSAVVTASQHAEIRKSLVEGYNAAQLGNYLSRELNLAAVESDTVHVIHEISINKEGVPRQSKWQPGRTPLEERHALSTVFKKTQPAKSKAKLAKQIMDLAWTLSIDKEDQQIGELEIALAPWQSTFLFDLVMDHRTMYRSLVASDLVLRVAEVKPYREDNVVRITARRQIAEQIAQRLKARLSMISETRVDMVAFQPLLARDPRGHNRLHDIFTESVLRDVGLRTRTVLEWSEDKNHISIHSLTSADAQSSRRLLLSFLELPSPLRSWTTESIFGGEEITDKPSWLPDPMKPVLSESIRSMDLGRLFLPHERMAGTSPDEVRIDEQLSNISDDQLNNTIEEVKDQLVQLVPPAPLPPKALRLNNRSYWLEASNAKQTTWTAQICRILKVPLSEPPLESTHEEQDEVKKSYRQSRKSGFIVSQPEIPGISTLLSYFKPIKRERSEPYVLAHLIPSLSQPSNVENLRQLPRVQVKYSLFQDSSSLSPQDLHLESLNAVTERQEVHVPLPAQSNDICFSRDFDLRSVASGADVLAQDKELQKLTESLQLSSSSDGGSASPVGGCTVTIRLPPSTASRVSKVPPRSDDVPFEYDLERIERVQVIGMIPMNVSTPAFANVDPVVKSLLGRFPRTVHLRYRQLESESAGGQRTDLTVIIEPGKHEDAAHSTDPKYGISKSGGADLLATGSLVITRLLSMIQAKTLGPFNAPVGVPSDNQNVDHHASHQPFQPFETMDESTRYGEELDAEADRSI